MNRRTVLIAIVVFIGALALLFFCLNEWRPALRTAVSLTQNTVASVPGVPVPGIRAPEGWQLSVFAADMPGARVIIRGPRGELIVSETREGKVTTLRPDQNADGTSDGRATLLRGLNHPHGIALKEEGGKGTLYVAETDTLTRFEYAGGSVVGFGEAVLSLPSGGRHVTRTLAALPDDRLLISVGSTCDVCFEEDERVGGVIAFDTATRASERFATGLRNTVFMTIHPNTGAIWGTDMGRDWLGNDLPPDEVNILREGGDYGWPLCYGKNILDTEFTKAMRLAGDPCASKTPSQVNLQAHSAPLGLAFIPEEGWPPEWANDLLVAYHGSWNRQIPTGYKIVRIPLDAAGNAEGEAVDFITGWLKEDGSVSGRPVDILLLPNGVGYITDDHAGVVYRFSRIAL